MIKENIFFRVLHVIETHDSKVNGHDILSALTEELGEYSRAVRVEDRAAICQNKEIEESSKIEIVDLMLVCIEAYILRGGTYLEMMDIANKKLTKWEEPIRSKL